MDRAAAWTPTSELLAILQRAWAEAVASTVPEEPRLEELLERRLQELAEAQRLDEASLLAVAQEAAQAALEVASAQTARDLSRHLRRAVYEYLLAVDAAVDLATLSGDPPGRGVDAPSVPAVPPVLIGLEEAQALAAQAGRALDPLPGGADDAVTAETVRITGEPVALGEARVVSPDARASGDEEASGTAVLEQGDVLVDRGHSSVEEGTDELSLGIVGDTEDEVAGDGAAEAAPELVEPWLEERCPSDEPAMDVEVPLELAEAWIEEGADAATEVAEADVRTDSVTETDAGTAVTPLTVGAPEPTRALASTPGAAAVDGRGVQVADANDSRCQPSAAPGGTDSASASAEVGETWAPPGGASQGAPHDEAVVTAPEEGGSREPDLVGLLRQLRHRRRPFLAPTADATGTPSSPDPSFASAPTPETASRDGEPRMEAPAVVAAASTTEPSVTEEPLRTATPAATSEARDGRERDRPDRLVAETSPPLAGPGAAAEAMGEARPPTTTWVFEPAVLPPVASAPDGSASGPPTAPLARDWSDVRLPEPSPFVERQTPSWRGDGDTGAPGATPVVPAPPMEALAPPTVPAAPTDGVATATAGASARSGWSVRQSPRQQLLAERMAAKRREEAVRIALEAAQLAAALSQAEGRRRKGVGPLRLPDVQGLRELVENELRRRKGADAAALLQRAAQEQGGREIADLALDAGDRCLALGQSRSATNCYLAAWRADPIYEAPLWKLADVCLADRRVELAIGYLERIATLMRSRGDDEGALAVYRKIVTIAPERTDIRDILRLYQSTGRFD